MAQGKSSGAVGNCVNCSILFLHKKGMNETVVYCISAKCLIDKLKLALTCDDEGNTHAEGKLVLLLPLDCGCRQLSVESCRAAGKSNLPS